MKVKIGPYLHWWGPYQLFGWARKFVSEERFERFADRIQPACQWVYDKRDRRSKIRIDPYDSWSMPDTLAPIILPLLLQLQETNHGTPIVDVEDIPEMLHTGKSFEDQTMEEAEAQWTWIMDEMIFAFRSIVNRDWEDQFLIDDGSEWGTLDVEGRKAYAQRVQYGFIMFGKYFQNLWD